MGLIKVKYLVTKQKKGKTYHFWQPKKRYEINGKWAELPKALQPCSLGTDAAAAHSRAQMLNHQLEQWRKSDEAPALRAESGTVGWLIGEYKKDALYKDLAPSTQKLYDNSLNEIWNVFADIPITAVTRKQAKALYQSFAGTKRKGAQVMQVANTLFNVAKDLAIISANPFEKQRVSKPIARQTIWTDEMLSAAKAKAFELGMPSIALALQLGVDIGQRPGDLRALGWNRYNGKRIELKQNKTGVWVSVAVMPELKAMLKATARTSPVILVEEATSKPYSKDMLCRRVREVCTAAGLHDVQFRDLRRTAVVRLALAGCTIPEICAITGHSLKEATQILKTYLPMCTQLADNAIAKLQKLEPR